MHKPHFPTESHLQAWPYLTPTPSSVSQHPSLGKKPGPPTALEQSVNSDISSNVVILNYLFLSRKPINTPSQDESGLDLNSAQPQYASLNIYLIASHVPGHALGAERAVMAKMAS